MIRPGDWVMRDPSYKGLCLYPACACSFIWCTDRHPDCPITGQPIGTNHVVLAPARTNEPQTVAATVSAGRGDSSVISEDSS